MFKLSIIFVTILLLTEIIYNDTAVTAPINSTASIRIAPKPHSTHDRASPINHEKISNINNESSHQINAEKTSYKGASSNNHEDEIFTDVELELKRIRKARIELEEAERKIMQQKEKKIFHDEKTKKAKVNILEPPNDSYIWGRHFHVRVRVESINNEINKRGDNKICLSLDKSPWYCWPISNARIHFIDVVEGKHTIVAKLYIDGKIKEESSSSVTSFTTVNDPDFLIDSEANLFNPSNSTADQDPNQGESHNISIHVPKIDLRSPAPFVTYSGTEIPILASISVQDADVIPFKQLFKYSYICIKIDNSTAYAGFPIFDITENEDNDSEMALALIPPQIVGLSSGSHSVDLGLSHPDTLSLIPETKMKGKKLEFYTSGDENKNALVVTNITVDNEIKHIGIMNGNLSSLRAQSEHFCDTIGNYKNDVCSGIVLKRLYEDWQAFELKSTPSRR